MVFCNSFMVYDQIYMMLTGSKEYLYMWHHFGVSTYIMS